MTILDFDKAQFVVGDGGKSFESERHERCIRAELERQAQEAVRQERVKALWDAREAVQGHFTVEAALRHLEAMLRAAGMTPCPKCGSAFVLKSGYVHRCEVAQ